MKSRDSAFPTVAALIATCNDWSRGSGRSARVKESTADYHNDVANSLEFIKIKDFQKILGNLKINGNFVIKRVY